MRKDRPIRPSHIIGGTLMIGLYVTFLAGFLWVLGGELHRAWTFPPARAVVKNVSGLEEDGHPTANCFITVGGKVLITEVTPRALGDDDVVRAWKPGKRVQVFYNPADPTEAVVTVGIEGGLWLAIVLFGPMAITTGIVFLGQGGLPVERLLELRGFAAWNTSGRRAVVFYGVSTICAILQAVIAVLTPWPWDLLIGLVLLAGVIATAWISLHRPMAARDSLQTA